MHEDPENTVVVNRRGLINLADITAALAAGSVIMAGAVAEPQITNSPAVVVFNNGALGFIDLEQKSTGFLTFGTELNNPNFAAMSEAVGIRGIRVGRPDQVDDGIAAAFAHDGPVLIDAVVNRKELAGPPLITLEMAQGFSLYVVKTIINGREIIDLAKTNLWRRVDWLRCSWRRPFCN
jgi:pyruvate dehydrogenase (quinone)